MKLGVLGANTGPFADPAGAAELARSAEAAGIDSLWTAEHTLWPDDYRSAYPYAESEKMPGEADTSLPDPFVWLTWCAAHSRNLLLATGITIVPHRHPAMMAKEVATLDHLSGGRVVLGIGVGWLEEEFDALGVPFAGRGRRTDEYIEVMRKLWATDSVSHHGEFVHFEGMNSNPKPVRRAVPIVVGGHSRAAAERAGRLGDGFAPLGGDVPDLIDMMRQAADAAGRDAAAIEVTSTHDGLRRGDPEEALGQLADWGVDRVLLPAHRLARGDVAANCTTWMDRVSATVRKGTAPE
jgi:probable F420-dependent oxidoreductase